VNSREKADIPRIHDAGRVSVGVPIRKEHEMDGSQNGFDWTDNKAVAVNQQDAIAVYANENGEVVIRRQKDWNEDDDSIIVVAPAYVRQLVEAIERTFKEIQAGPA
jgi:hypothetical protein